MRDFEDFKVFLPRYLSDPGALYVELANFPDNIDDRIYMSKKLEEETVFQGDGFPDLPYVHLPDATVRQTKCLVLSNTCDICLNNKRFVPPRVVYGAIIDLEKYEKRLRESGAYPAPEAVRNHISDIRKQRVTSIFYLPKHERLGHEGMVLLDSLFNCPIESVCDSEMPRRRLFTLSDYGFYLLLLKISVHFSRLQENFNRG